MPWLAHISVAAVLLFPPPLQQSTPAAQTPGSTFNSAVAAMQAGSYAEAETGFNAVLAADPQSLPALGNLAVLYSRTHRFAKAVALDERALMLAPENPDLLLNLGLAYLKEERYGEATTPLQRLAELEPSNPRPALLLATAMVLGDAPEAGLQLLQSRKLEGADSSALYLEAVAYARLNQLAAAEAIFHRLLASGSTRAQASFLLGEALHDGHKLTEAADSFLETLRLDPAYPGARRELGKVYLSMQHFPDAERELRAAVAQDSQDGSALYFLGAMLVQTAREAEGVPFLTRAEALMPDSWAIPFYLGKAAYEQGKPADAVPLLRRAATMNADEPQLFYLLARALRATGHADEAKSALARVEELHSTALKAEKEAISTRVAGAR